MPQEIEIVVRITWEQLLQGLALAGIVAPVMGAIIAGLTSGRKAGVIAVLFAGLTAIFALLPIPQSITEPVTFRFGDLPWLPGRMAGEKLFGVWLDQLSALMLLMVVIIGFLVVFYSTAYIGPKNREHPVHNGKGRYFFWLLLFVASMVGVATAPNFLQLFIAWEITTLCSWALISYYDEHPEALRAGFKALLMTHIGGLFLMTAIVILFIQTRSFEFTALNQVPIGLRNILFVLILVGAWSKAAQFPFNTWLPDAMEAPTPISAYLHAAAMVKAGVYLVARTVVSCEQFLYSMGVLTGVMAIVTMFIAVYLFFFQDDLKRLLALSTISHLAYILIGCALGIFRSDLGYHGGLLHIAAHGAGKGLLFLCVGALAYFTGSKRISELSGVALKLPLVAVGFFVGVLTVTGIPPFACFWSKLMLIMGALQHGGFGIWLAVFMLAESMVVFSWFLYVGQRVFFGEPSKAALQIASHSAPIEITLVVLMLLCLGITPMALPFVWGVVLP